MSLFCVGVGGGGGVGIGVGGGSGGGVGVAEFLCLFYYDVLSRFAP